MDKILLTTTPQLSGVKIEKYIGLVTANQVIGTGFFNDLIASFSDIFGGMSGAYREQMNELFDNVKEMFMDKARNVGANAVIGISIDYDSISAKTMSMFMISIKGTAVRLEEQEMDTVSKEVEVVSREELQVALTKKLIEQKIDDDVELSDTDWRYLCVHKITDVAPKLLKKYEKYRDDTFAKHFKNYLSSIDYKYAVDLMYVGNVKLYSTIVDCNLFCPQKVYDVFQESGIHKNLLLLKADKPSYDKEDVEIMNRIVSMIKIQPDTGEVTYVKGILGSSKKFVCSCGAKNDADSVYCYSCQRDIRGYNEAENRILKNFFLKVEALNEIFDNTEDTPLPVIIP